MENSIVSKESLVNVVCGSAYCTIESHRRIIKKSWKEGAMQAMREHIGICLGVIENAVNVLYDFEIISKEEKEYIIQRADAERILMFKDGFSIVAEMTAFEELEEEVEEE